MGYVPGPSLEDFRRDTEAEVRAAVRAAFEEYVNGGCHGAAPCLRPRPVRSPGSFLPGLERLAGRRSRRRRLGCADAHWLLVLVWVFLFGLCAIVSTYFYL